MTIRIWEVSVLFCFERQSQVYCFGLDQRRKDWGEERQHGKWVNVSSWPLPSSRHPGNPTHTLRMDLWITCSRARHPLKFKVHPKAEKKSSSSPGFCQWCHLHRSEHGGVQWWHALGWVSSGRHLGGGYPHLLGHWCWLSSSYHSIFLQILTSSK